MKRFLVLLWVAIGLLLVPSAAYGQAPGNTPARPNAQAPSSAVPSEPDTSIAPRPVNPDAEPSSSSAASASSNSNTPNPNPDGKTVINLPQPPFMELSGSGGAAFTSTVASNCLSCVQPFAFPAGRFASFVPTAAQVGAGTSADTRVAFEIDFAQGFKRFHDFTLVAEFPLVFTPNREVKSGNSLVARSYSTLFFTPALRIMYAPDRKQHPSYPALYPWFSMGGGLAHFSPSSVSLSGGPSGARSSTEGALQAGVGVDFGVYGKAITLRTEVRDFYTGSPNLGVAGINLRHNLVASGGIVFRFCKDCWSLPKKEK